MQREEAISELQATANKQKFQKPNKHVKKAIHKHFFLLRVGGWITLTNIF